MIKLKTCVSCKKEKPKTDEFFFYRNKEKGYLSSWCKDCRIMNREKTWDDELEAQRKRRGNLCQEAANARAKKARDLKEQAKEVKSKEEKEVKVKIYANKECLSCSVSFKPLSSVAKRCADCAKTHKAKEKRESKCIYKRRVRIATPSWEDKNAIKEFYKNCPDGFHVDHIIPLRGKNVTGLHTLSNLQYLPKEENMRKSNTYSLGE